MIDIEHRALRAFEQDPVSGATCLVEPLPDRFGKRQKPRSYLEQRIEHVSACTSTECSPEAFSRW